MTTKKKGKKTPKNGRQITVSQTIDWATRTRVELMSFGKVGSSCTSSNPRHIYIKGQEHHMFWEWFHLYPNNRSQVCNMMFYRGKLCNMRKYGTVCDTLVLYNSTGINVIIIVWRLIDISLRKTLPVILCWNFSTVIKIYICFVVV